MERLTEYDEYGNTDIIGVDSANFQLNLEFKEFNLVTDALNKLSAYEDTGLTPEEITTLKEELDISRSEVQGLSRRLIELQADRDYWKAEALKHFDVDKVVEQLKECERYVYDAVSDEDNYVIDTEKAIEIVKGVVKDE